MYNVLITGAGSGIGKAFVRALVQDPNNFIIAIDKDFASPVIDSYSPHNDSQGILEAYRKDVGLEPGSRSAVKLFQIDISAEAQLAQFSELTDLQLVVHSAGIRGLVPSVPIRQGSDVAGAETMDVMNVKTMLQTFNTNAIGTFVLLRYLIPTLRANKGKVIIMGSRMGSIGHNSTGGGYAYRASKAALNAIVKSFSLDVPEVCFAIVHPGRVETNLVGVGVREDGAVHAEQSVNDMLDLVSRLGRDHSGRFMDRFGNDIVW